MPLVTLTLREGKSAQFKTAVIGAVHQTHINSGWAFAGGRVIHA
jgi:hypothetical protein